MRNEQRRERGRIERGHPKLTDWEEVMEEVIREKEIESWYGKQIKNKKFLLALANNMLEKLFWEISMREDIIREAVARNVRIVQPQAVEVEVSCKVNAVRVLLNNDFCEQDDIALNQMEERMRQISKSLGFEVYFPLNLRENQYFYLILGSQ